MNHDVRELAARLDADRAGTERLVAVINARQSAIERLAAELRALSARSPASALDKAAGLTASAASDASILAGSLAKARFFALRAVHGMGFSSRAPDPPTAVIGDPVTAPESTPGPFQAELKGSDDGDPTKGKAQRFSRGMVRNIGDLQAQTKTTTKSAYQLMAADFHPETSHHIDHSPPARVAEPHGSPTPEGMVTQLLAMTIVATEAAFRFIKRKGRRHRA